jgi:hypothetical protein
MEAIEHFDRRFGLGRRIWGSFSVASSRPEGLDFESWWGKDFSLLHVVQTGSGAQPPVQWMAMALFQVLKRPGSGSEHSPPTSAEVKRTWMYISTPPYVFMA